MGQTELKAANQDPKTALGPSCPYWPGQLHFTPLDDGVTSRSSLAHAVGPASPPAALSSLAWLQRLVCALYSYFWLAPPAAGHCIQLRSGPWFSLLRAQGHHPHSICSLWYICFTSLPGAGSHDNHWRQYPAVEPNDALFRQAFNKHYIYSETKMGSVVSQHPGEFSSSDISKGHRSQLEEDPTDQSWDNLGIKINNGNNRL